MIFKTALALAATISAVIAEPVPLEKRQLPTGRYVGTGASRHVFDYVVEVNENAADGTKCFQQKTDHLSMKISHLRSSNLPKTYGARIRSAKRLTAGEFCADINPNFLKQFAGGNFAMYTGWADKSDVPNNHPPGSAYYRKTYDWEEIDMEFLTRYKNYLHTNLYHNHVSLGRTNYEGYSLGVQAGVNDISGKLTTTGWRRYCIQWGQGWSLWLIDGVPTRKKESAAEGIVVDGKRAHDGSAWNANGMYGYFSYWGDNQGAWAMGDITGADGLDGISDPAMINNPCITGTYGVCGKA